jgi:hypothetical protein
VLPGRASDALWTSKVLDAQFPSRFGELTFRGEGKLSLQTRSGNTEKPDDGWSEWSAPLTAPGPIRSPGARFLQIRARLDTAAPSTLYAVQAYYLPRNQPTTLKEITVKPNPPKRGDAGGEDGPTTQYKVEWKLDNPDGDRLRFRLSYRPEGRSDLRPILRESEILTKTSYEWNTEGVPDGYYRVRIEASDELDNPDRTVARDYGDSEPFLLDNHPPTVDGLRVDRGVLRGVARDAQGPVSKLEYALDGGDWKPFHPRDDLFDTREEAFEVALPGLAKGTHVVAVRVRDARSNMASAEIWFVH